MHLKTATTKSNCDCHGCKNLADFYIDTKGIFKTRVFFCEECLKKMFKGYLGTSVPKSIESPFKLKNRIRKEDK